MTDAAQLLDALIHLDARIRCVGILVDGVRERRAREGLENACSGEHDRAGELLVDPPVRDRGRRRGNAGRSGTRDVVVRFDHVWHVAMACRGGHVSIAIDRGGDPLAIAALVAEVLIGHGR